MSKMKQYNVIVSCEGEDEGRYKQISQTYTIDATCKDEAENEALDIFHAEVPFDGDYNTVATAQEVLPGTPVEVMPKAKSYKQQLEELKESARVGPNGIALSRGLSEGNMAFILEEITRWYQKHSNPIIAMNTFLNNLDHSIKANASPEKNAYNVMVRGYTGAHKVVEETFTVMAWSPDEAEKHAVKKIKGQLIPSIRLEAKVQ
jgi:hypothetical protein